MFPIVVYGMRINQTSSGWILFICSPMGALRPSSSLVAKDPDGGGAARNHMAYTPRNHIATVNLGNFPLPSLPVQCLRTRASAQILGHP